MLGVLDTPVGNRGVVKADGVSDAARCQLVCEGREQLLRPVAAVGLNNRYVYIVLKRVCEYVDMRGCRASASPRHAQIQYSHTGA